MCVPEDVVSVVCRRSDTFRTYTFMLPLGQLDSATITEAQLCHGAKKQTKQNNDKTNIFKNFLIFLI